MFRVNITEMLLVAERCRNDKLQLWNSLQAALQTPIVAHALSCGLHFRPNRWQSTEVAKCTCSCGELYVEYFEYACVFSFPCARSTTASAESPVTLQVEVPQTASSCCVTTPVLVRVHSSDGPDGKLESSFSFAVHMPGALHDCPPEAKKNSAGKEKKHRKLLSSRVRSVDTDDAG